MVAEAPGRTTLDRLAALIDARRESLLEDWRRQVSRLPSAAGLSAPALRDHVPQLLDEIAERMRASEPPALVTPIDEASACASLAHGLQRLDVGLDIEEVVAEYGVLRACVHEAAEQAGLVLQGEALRRLNRAIDHAIGLAIRSYAAQREIDVQKQRESYLRGVVHELRSPMNTVSLVTDVLELSAPRAATGVDLLPAVQTLRRGLQRIDTLVDRVLDENRDAGAGAPDSSPQNVELWPLVQKLMLERPPHEQARLHNDVPQALLARSDAWALEKALRCVIEQALDASGADIAPDDTNPTAALGSPALSVSAAPAAEGGIEIRFTVPRAAFQLRRDAQSWQASLLTAGEGAPPALQDTACGQALKRLVDTQGASLRIESTADDEGLLMHLPQALDD